MRLAVIPARGGSKRIPRKNIRLFGGKPMIGWSISAARDSGLFDRIIVSTDDAEIADVARTLGAEAPFMRPAELSDDHTGTTPVIAHAVDWHNAQGDAQATEVCCLYATAPFIAADDLRRGLETLHGTGADYAFSVTSFPAPIQRALRITDANRIEMFDPAHFNTRSQDLEDAWHDAGQFYWGHAAAWLAHKVSYLPQTRFAYAIPQHRDDRGVFVEMLKTLDCGQVSFLTVNPGVTRGGHYHHTKVEKFLVLKGNAAFRFRHILTDERLEIRTSGDAPQVVETIPGWSHDITNIGSEEMVVILWANEVFDRDRPDTITSKV